jgi:hypothetical protein
MATSVVNNRHLAVNQTKCTCPIMSTYIHYYHFRVLCIPELCTRPRCWFLTEKSQKAFSFTLYILWIWRTIMHNSSKRCTNIIMDLRYWTDYERMLDPPSPALYPTSSSSPRMCWGGAIALFTRAWQCLSPSPEYCRSAVFYSRVFRAAPLYSYSHYRLYVCAGMTRLSTW